ncbi:uncharacterized protein LOC134206052 [Armigeres subalbatus]|uniref:uncharacterized protein LOC134206052 n=1 Tax=Armigeres subalbatus TaxID=124917 RepID=UPI002ED423C5
MQSTDYDNGATGRRAESPEKFIKIIKRKAATKIAEELSKVKAELEKTRMEKDELSRILATKGQEDNEFAQARSSTIREEHSANETLLMTMNNMSLGSLNIPECVPATGESELSKRDYDHWKNVLNASLNLIQAVDESTRFDLLRIKAGSLLLELLDGTTTQCDMPNEREFPYSNAIARLDAHFGSRAYMLSQRSKLANMVQRSGETNIQFVKRVALAAKLCNYKADEEFEAISRSVTRGSTDSRVRTLAYRVLTEGGSLNELIDQVRIREVELENEKDYRRLHQPQSATVAAISRRPDEYVQRRRGPYEASRGYNNSRGRGSFVRGPMRNQRLAQTCWRCMSAYHSPEQCFHSDKVCRNCNRRGHIARACSAQFKSEPMKRGWTGDESEPPTKIAAVHKTEEEMLDTKVSHIILPGPIKSDIGRVISNEPIEKAAYIVAYVAGIQVLFFIDSGAQVNTITMESFNAILQDKHAKKNLHELTYGSDKTLRAYATQGSIDVVATFSAQLFVSDERPVTTEKFYVVREKRALLGFNTAVRYSLLKVGLEVSVEENNELDWPCEFNLHSIDASLSEFPKFNVPAVVLSYDKSMPPSRNVYTHIPAAFKELTNQKLNELRQTGIIEKVTNDMDKSFEVMQTVILSECEGTVNYLDDVMVFGQTIEEHDRNLQKVLKKLEDHNVMINQDKCFFGKEIVKFLGFKVTNEGWQVESEKISAIQDARRPETPAEVKSFLGLVTFIDRFIFQRADKTRHLRELSKAKDFYWNQELEDEFLYLKTSAWKHIKTLGYFNRDDETELFVDASPYGLGAILVQYDSESKPRIISCASKALTLAEKKYPQTQKEALAMVWGVERFSVYLLNIHFTIRTDAESNEFIFGGSHRIGKRAVSRAEAWALRLQPYNFKVVRVPGELNMADALSRLVTESQATESFDESHEKHLLYYLDTGSMEFTWDDIETEAERDAEQILIRESIRTNCWEKNLKRYESEAKNLRVLGALVFKNDRVVLPYALRDRAMRSAHQGHMGASSMKKILRNYFWWPCMSKHVETFVMGCETCFRLSKKNPPVPLTSRDLPDGPWEILQVDFFSFKDCGSGEFLVVVDVYSRYLHVVEMKQIDADSTNAALSRIFEVWGYPIAIHSDNGPPFQGEKFIKTWENRGVKIRKAIPLSAQSNGAVERQNKGLKDTLAAAKIEKVNWKMALEQYLHMHNKSKANDEASQEAERPYTFDPCSCVGIEGLAVARKREAAALLESSPRG